MPRIDDYIEAPYMGVSQAPAQVRLKQQAEVIEETSLSIPQGAEKRAPFEFMAALSGHTGNTGSVFDVVNSRGLDFALTLTDPFAVMTPGLYPLAGVPVAYPCVLASEAITVEPAAQAYLDVGSVLPNVGMTTLTVEDYTFILNRSVTVAKLAGASSTRPFEAMLWMRAAAYARTYIVTVSPSGGSPITVSIRTPNGKDSTDGNFVDTDILAQALIDGLYPVGTGSATAITNGATVSGDLASLSGAGFTVSRVAGVIYLSHPSTDFTVSVQDGQGGTALTVIKDKVQSFSDLPKRANDGFVVRVGQSTGTEQDDFFVTFHETAGPGTGIWEETIGPGSELGLDADTMPVGLVYELGAWALKVLPWQGRLVGDETLSPDPDFVGRTIQDICFWKERLGIISAEGTCHSSADDPFKMYPTTLSSVLASDAVSFLNPFDQKAEFAFAVPFKEKLVVWGKKAQAQITSGDQGITTSGRIDEFSTYEYSSQAPPQGSNNRLYFIAPRGPNYSAVYEMEINQTTNTVEADDLSVSVPKYIPAGVDRVASCPVNYQVVYGVSGQSRLLPHLFRYVDKQRAQNAWSSWSLPEGWTFGGAFFRNTSLYIMASYLGVAYLLRQDNSPGSLDPDASATIRTSLDLRLTEAQVQRVYNAGPDTTTVTLPYPAPENIQVVARAPGGLAGPSFAGALLEAPEGTLAEVLSTAGYTVTLSGDWTGVPLYCGVPYTKLIQLSRLYARDGNGNPLRSSRLSLRVLILDLDKTAHLQVRVTVGARAPKLYTFDGGFVDDPDSTYGKLLLYSGPWRLPIKGSNEKTKIELINDSPFPSNVLGFSWEGEQNLRAQRTQG